MFINTSGRVGIGLTDPISRLCLSCDYNNGESTGFSIDSRDASNVYNLKLFSFVQGSGQVGYKFKVRNIADTYEPLTLGYNGRVGIQNNQPQAFLHLGNCDVNGSNPAIVFGKNNSGGGRRNAFISYSDDFIFCIGDNGGTNVSSTLTPQFGIHYAAPGASLVIALNGYVTMQYGFGVTSDERIKTNIKTIENALDKTLLLRGVEYNDFRIEPERKRIGLIAQEVELVVPEVVITSDKGMKSIEYQNLVGLLIESIKEQQKQINELKNILKNNNLN